MRLHVLRSPQTHFIIGVALLAGSAIVGVNYVAMLVSHVDPRAIRALTPDFDGGATASAIARGVQRNLREEGVIGSSVCGVVGAAGWLLQRRASRADPAVREGRGVAITAFCCSIVAAVLIFAVASAAWELYINATHTGF